MESKLKQDLAALTEASQLAQRQITEAAQREKSLRQQLEDHRNNTDETDALQRQLDELRRAARQTEQQLRNRIDEL